MLATERVLFKQRAEVKDMKRKLNIKDDDEDLINQKVRLIVYSMPFRPNIDQRAAQEKANGCATVAASKGGSARYGTEAWHPNPRRLAVAGRCSSREGERNPAGHQSQHRKAYQVERGLCGFHQSSSITLARADIRTFFSSRHHNATADSTILGFFRKYAGFTDGYRGSYVVP